MSKKSARQKPSQPRSGTPKGGRQSAAAKAAALRAQQEQQERRRRMYVVGGVAALLAIIVLGGYLLQSLGDTSGEEATPPAGVTDGYGVVVGEASAPTTVQVYEDFLCPVCGVFEEATAEQLAEAVDAGRIRVDYRMVAFLDGQSSDDYSTRAANAAAVVLDAAGPEVFREFHDALFAEQPAEGGAGLSDDRLVELAVEAGAEEDAVRPGIEDRAFEQWTRNATDAMSQAGVRGTPTVFVDGEQVEGESLQAIVDATLAVAAGE
ncbi:DsbA family protein [Nocardioides donggukensis]|uniref:Thioredoxin domain-containing protein n=1 Tax=Nocardioides donggukensis TaxID=2774019 RepID=A0A927K343_9ACTN|nr:thioredoxin domain-containing protein [Nocardioides donggukensis]MBD8868851.1 thioredoxin domain-containing protein [Nocardioides donggukensis]